MTNEVSDINPNVKMDGISSVEKEGNEPSAIDKVREDLERGAVTVPVMPAQDGQTSAQPEQIRIVIRDAKPPLAARFLQGAMRFICFVLLICVCGIGIPRLFGINEFNVMTGSMSPTYPVGTLVFVQPKDPSTIRPGEVVTVIMNENLDMITHRVVSNNYDDKTLTTKGDANNSEDGPSLYENVVGVVCFSVPNVGGVVDYLTNDSQGRIVGIAFAIGILALTFIAEGLCVLMTKQDANVYQKNSKKSYSVKSVKARHFDKNYSKKS